MALDVLFCSWSRGGTLRACIGAVCGGESNFFSNELASHKSLSGSWTPSISAGTHTVKLQACVKSGATINLDANDSLSWVVHTGNGSTGGGSADNLGDHTATQNLVLGSNYISGDGDNEGIQVDASGNVTFAQDATFSGNVGIGTTVPSGKLDIEGGDVFLRTGTLTNTSANEDLSVSGNVEVDGIFYGDGSGLTNIPTTGIANNAITVDKIDFASSNGLNIPQLASDPGSGTEGQLYYNTADDKLKVYANGSWSEVGTSSGGSNGVWVNFDGHDCGGGSCTIRDSNGVSSVVRNAAGDYTINFSSNQANDGYAVSSDCSNGFTSDASYSFSQTIGTKSVSAVRIICRHYTSGATYDSRHVSVILADSNGVGGGTAGIDDQASSTALKINSSGNVGIGTTGPAVKLDVSGEIKVGNSGIACSGTTEGSQRYNSTTKLMEFCNGTSWTTFGGLTYSESPQQTVRTSGTAVTWLHGAGAMPKRFGAYLVAITANNGYSIGDRIALSAVDGDGARQEALYSNSTQIGWNSVNTQIIRADKTGTSNFNIVNNDTNWRIVFWIMN
jgi:hypothetical protein